MTPPAAAAAPAVHPHRTATPGRRSAPSRPRRVSGPSRRGVDARPPRPREGHPEAQGAVALAALGGLSPHALLDRLLRGRTWIALVAFALIGIVTLQLGLLKLNASIGRTLEKQAALQRQNASLSIENSELSAGDRVESRAARIGMELVPVGALRFLAARPRIDVGRGASVLSTPLQSSSTGSEAATSGSSGSPGAAPVAASPPTTVEPTSTQAAAGAPSSGESPSSSSREASTSSGEAAAASSAGASSPAATTSTTPPSSAAPRPAPASAEQSAGSAPEASPGGGTQAGPTG